MTFSKRYRIPTVIGVAAIVVAPFAVTHLVADETSGEHDTSLHCQHFPKDCADNATAEQEADNEHGATSGMGAPLAPGQEMFGAISEINTLIEDAGMGWVKVDLDALWEHLKDMDALMTGAVVTKTELKNGLSMIVSGNGAAARAVENMIPTHASFLRSVRPNWDIQIDGENARYEVIVTASNEAEIERIKALGFSGFMVQDDHHASHHLGIATGEVVH